MRVGGPRVKAPAVNVTRRPPALVRRSPTGTAATVGGWTSHGTLASVRPCGSSTVSRPVVVPGLASRMLTWLGAPAVRVVRAGFGAPLVDFRVTGVVTVAV